MPSSINGSPDPLVRERQKVPQFLTMLIITTISGFATYFNAQHGIWQQWTYLLHTAIGFYLSLLILSYVFTHFQRTNASRRSLQMALGLLVLCILLSLVGTGAYIGIVGQYESGRWIYQLHIVASYATLVIFPIPKLKSVSGK